MFWYITVHSVNISSKSEMVELEAFIELTWNEPINLNYQAKRKHKYI